MTIDVDTLRQHSKLFELLDDDGRQSLLDMAEQQRFERDDVVVKEGDAGESFFVITAGEVRVLIDDLTGQKEVARLPKGAFVGEIGALMGEPRSATVQAIVDVDVLAFDAARVNTLLEGYPKIREAIVKLALKRSEDNLQQMLDS